MVVTLLVLVLFVMLGVNTDGMVRREIRDEAFLKAEMTTLRWSAHARNGQLPHPVPTSDGIDLIQVVDAQGRI